MAYNKTTWQDLPNETTPINASNLNKIENELKKIDNYYESGTALTSGQDLNNIKTIGNYNVNTSAISESLVNSPTQNTFILEVRPARQSGSVRQTIYTVLGDIFFRVWSGANWSSWRKLINESNLATTSSNGLMSASDKNKIDNSIVPLGVFSLTTGTLTLSESVSDFKALIISIGTVGNGTYSSHIIVPYQHSWRYGSSYTDINIYISSTQKLVGYLSDSTHLVITTNTIGELVRAIYGMY